MSDDRRDIDALIGGLLDRTITPEQMAELSEHIRADASVADRAAELMLLSSDASEVMKSDSGPQIADASGASARSVYRIPTSVAIAAALLLSAAVVAVYVFVVSRPASPVPSEPVPIATVIEGDGLMIDDDFGVPGRDYAAGRYATSAGVAELQLTSGANVRVFGRTDMTFHDAMSLSLKNGHARFRCPPSAHGFTVHLPGGAHATDLGTEFDIDVRGGAYQITVSKGLVGYVGGPDATVGYLIEPGRALARDERGRAIEPSTTPLITAVETNTDHPWAIVPSGFGEDVVALIGRPAQWNGITEAGLPVELVGHDMVRSAKADSADPDLRVKLTLARPAVLYVLLNEHIDTPDWLSADYERTDLRVGLDSTGNGRTEPGVGPGQSIDVEFVVWRRIVDGPGVIELGPNGNRGSRSATYGVVAAPLESIK